MNKFYQLFICLVLLQATFSMAKAIEIKKCKPKMQYFNIDGKEIKAEELNKELEGNESDGENFKNIFLETYKDIKQKKNGFRDGFKKSKFLHNLKKSNSTNIVKRATAGEYFGNQLSTAQYKVYKGFKDIAENIKTKKTNKIDVTDLSQYKIKKSDVDSLIRIAYSAFFHDYPNYWWNNVYGRGYSYSNDYILKISLTLYINNNHSLSDIISIDEEIEDVMETIVAEADDMGTYNRISHFYYRLGNYVSFKQSTHSHDVKGPLIDRKAVCEGYARAFKYLCDNSNLQTLLIYGKLIKGDNIGAHTWNYVNVYSNWYAVDVSEDDYDGYMDGNYLLVGTTTEITDGVKYSQSRKVDSTLRETSKNFSIPNIRSKSYL